MVVEATAPYGASALRFSKSRQQALRGSNFTGPEHHQSQSKKTWCAAFRMTYKKSIGSLTLRKRESIGPRAGPNKLYINYISHINH
jgi:hypothetical protein